MINLHAFQKITDYEWELPVEARKSMLVPVRVFATRRLLEAALGDLSIEQAANAASLPGVVGPVVVMPDVHQGYGLPIGGVMATRYPEGIISPGGIGYDINCGVRLLSSSIPLEAVEDQLASLAAALNRHCPSGVGSEGGLRLADKELEQACLLGSRWAVKKGMASEADIRRTEENGCLEGANFAPVSVRARERGRSQLGTLGAGNHFIEVDFVEQIFDAQAAAAMGLQEGCLTLSIHCGSRGFGHQICTDFVQALQSTARRHGISLADRELVCAPMDSAEGKDYLAAMRAAANFAFLNRQILAHLARQAFEEALAGKVSDWELRPVYDIAHNIGKIETHVVDGEKVRVCVHRKGATRAFGPGHPAVPEEYRATGQPVLVPGSMGTASWVLAGMAASMERSFGSSCHGAGRVLSRSAAKKQVRGERLLQDLSAQGIHVQAGSMSGLAEEAPEAYKDVDAVVETVCGAGLTRKVARLRPVAVVKG